MLLVVVIHAENLAETAASMAKKVAYFLGNFTKSCLFFVQRCLFFRQFPAISGPFWPFSTHLPSFRRPKMVEAVFIFALISAVFELGALAYLEPRTRLRWLNRPGTITFVVTLANLLIHWGTITGSMTAATAGLASMGATALARWYWGWITVVDGRVRYYHGIVRFTREQLM